MERHVHRNRLFTAVGDEATQKLCCPYLLSVHEYARIYKSTNRRMIFGFRMNKFLLREIRVEARIDRIASRFGPRTDGATGFAPGLAAGNEMLRLVAARSSRVPF